MYRRGDLALLKGKQLRGGPWTEKGTLTMVDLTYPVEVLDVTYVESAGDELCFLVRHLTGEDRLELVYSFNLLSLTS